MITGGAGFIGSHLCEKYTLEGHHVTCLDNLLTGSVTNINHLLDFGKFKFVEGDIRNSELLGHVMGDVEVVFHLAAQIHVDRSCKEPRLTWDINVMGTQNILELARFHDVRRVIHASTSEVYGSAQYVPIDENHPLCAPHPYGASKIAADRMCYAYGITYGMDIALMRMFNVFGPHQRDYGYGGVISIFTRRILNDQPPVIYGDGRQMRDYTYVEDVVRAYDMVLNHKDRISEPINFGTGQETSIIGIAEKIIEHCGETGNIEPVFVDPRIGEVNRLIADASQAKDLLGWEARHSLDSGLEKFVKWYRSFGFEERMKIE